MIINKIDFLSMLMPAICLLASCNNETVAPFDSEEQGWHTATMVMNASKEGFDGSTKAAGSWEDGDVLYLFFTKGSNKVQGKAVYSATESSWTVSYKGSLRGTSETAVSLWYFDGADTESSGSLALSTSTVIYADESGKYTYPSDGDMVVTGSLKPYTSRIRFKGAVELNIKVGGISHYTSFNLSTGVLSALDGSVALLVQTDGYTPYLYGAFTNTENRTLSITNGDAIFTINCSANVLQTGKSGWMNVPTVDSHDGWTMVDFNGHEYVDLELTSGTLWATMNVGAEKPEDYGDYFAWGETTGYNSGKTNFEDSTYKWCNGSSSTMTKYCTNSSYGTVDNKTELELDDDAARANWGSGWRMPSIAQIDELISECNIVWSIQGGVYGCKVTSMKNGNSIFLPAGGNRRGSKLYDPGFYGDYWSRSLYKSYNAYGLNFYPGSFSRGYYLRCYGNCVRPVVSV